MKQEKIVIVIVLVIMAIVLIGSTGYFIATNKRAPDQKTTQVPQPSLGIGADTPVADDGKIDDADHTNFNDTSMTDQPIAESNSGAVQITDGIKHTVPLNEIVGGGPSKDGIPSIDDPKFVSISQAEAFINDADPGLAFSRDGISRFYPFQILVWHEIVNDVFNGERVLITYCPLCLSGIVFDPIVQGERVEFGTSGKLWNSNLVMYDRKTDTYWSQILGEAIRGELAGEALTVLPSDQIRFGEWKAANPSGEVLSRDTGATRFYGTDPYGDYYTDNNAILFGGGALDDRLENKDFVLGVVIDGLAKAYYPPSIKERGEVVDSFAGRTIVARYDAALDVVRLFERAADGTETRINPFPNFWFSWVGTHPDTQLYK